MVEPFQNCHFWAYVKKKCNHFLLHGHSSWSTFGLHLVRAQKTLWIDFFKKLDNVRWSIERTHLQWLDFMVHGVNRALVKTQIPTTNYIKPAFKSRPGGKKNPKAQPTSSILAMWNSIEIFIHWKYYEDVIQNYPYVDLKRGPMTFLTNENSRMFTNHGLMSFV